MEIDMVGTKLPIKDLQRNMGTKVAVLFRGPMRPSPYTTAIHTSLLMNELKSYGYNITTYLVTWPEYKDYNALELISMGLYDNVLLQQIPTKQLESHVKRKSYGIYPNSNVFNMYHQSKTAIDLIIASDDYDYIVHSRTDLHVKFGKYIQDWFDPDFYGSPNPDTPWICDWIGIATPDIMHKAWNYVTHNQLGKLIDESEIPEQILMSMIDKHNIAIKTNEVEEIWLDPDRVRFD
jgi:hypothetical protein